MADNLLLHFPKNDTPRLPQLEALKAIQKAIANGKKFIIVQAPTGSGKSHIAATLANFSRDPDSNYVRLVKSHDIFKKYPSGGYVHEGILEGKPSFGCVVLTVTKALQNQYKKLFPETEILKGKQNYVCEVDHDLDCDLGLCLVSKKLLDECKAIDRCPHMNARVATLSSKLGSLNYSAYMSLPEHVKKRQFIICDEASELEEEIVNRFSLSIEYAKTNIKELGMDKITTDDRSVAHQWITDLSVGLKDKVEELTVTLQNIRGNSETKRKLMFKTRFYKGLYEKVVVVLKNWYLAQFVVEFNKDGCLFTPLHVNMLAGEFFKSGDTIILMSGTIIDHQTFATTLGIQNYEYIEVDSEFDSKKSPIYCSQKYKLTFKTMDQVLPHVVKQALLICKHHKDHNGIIHTHSFKITEAIKNAIAGQSRYLLREAGITNEILLRDHFERKDKTVIVSPSLGFGTDLAHDYGRFQIIMKTPYPPLGSKRIKILAEKSQRWYEMKTLVNLVQMCGRTTRSKEDFSDTYILDGQAINLIKRNHQKLPRWFLKRLN